MSSVAPRNPLFINTILLGGGILDKVGAARAAGFDQIELWRQDVEAHGNHHDSLFSILRQHGLGLTDYQVLLDFDGAPDSLRESKRTEAILMLETAVTVGATTLLVPACTNRECVADRIEDDLRWLAREAASRQLRIAYECMAWSTVNFTLAAAWKCVKRLDEPNVGIVVDAFHIFARSRDARDLDGIPMDRIYLVQLSDLGDGIVHEHLITTARHRRLLPGRGHFPIETILNPLKEAGYAGPVGLEVFNDELKAHDPYIVAREAMASLREVWLGSKRLSWA
jgi:4-hydroxyphenylpyruvate dioxygenase